MKKRSIWSVFLILVLSTVMTGCLGLLPIKGNKLQSLPADPPFPLSSNYNYKQDFANYTWVIAIHSTAPVAEKSKEIMGLIPGSYLNSEGILSYDSFDILIRNRPKRASKIFKLMVEYKDHDDRFKQHTIERQICSQFLQYVVPMLVKKYPYLREEVKMPPKPQQRVSDAESQSATFSQEEIAYYLHNATHLNGCL